MDASQARFVDMLRSNPLQPLKAPIRLASEDGICISSGGASLNDSTNIRFQSHAGGQQPQITEVKREKRTGVTSQPAQHGSGEVQFKTGQTALVAFHCAQVLRLALIGEAPSGVMPSSVPSPVDDGSAFLLPCSHGAGHVQPLGDAV